MTKSAPVKTVVCGINDSPPPSTEVLVLAWDWDADSAADAVAGQLDFLAALPRLCAALVWDVSLLRFPRRSWEVHWIQPPPPLPASLTHLRHLVFFDASGLQTVADTDLVSIFHDSKAEAAAKALVDAFLASISGIHALRTLVLPSIGEQGYSGISFGFLEPLTQLQTLFVDTCDRDDGHVIQTLTVLRRLHVCHYKVVERFGDPPHSLSKLTALESFTVARRYCPDYTPVWEDEVETLARLSALTRLQLKDPVWLETRLSQRPCAFDVLAKLTQLVDLDVDVLLAATVPLPLAQMPCLTRLRLNRAGEYESDNVEEDGLRAVNLRAVHLQQLSALTTLKELDLSCLGRTFSEPLRSVTSLTSLTVNAAGMTQSDGQALACLTGLQRLCLDSGRLKDGHALAELRALTDLRELTLTACHGLTSSDMDQLRLADSFPQLEYLAVRAELLPVEGQTLLDLRGLSGLKELVVSGPISGVALKPLGKIQALRRVSLRDQKVWREQSWEPWKPWDLVAFVSCKNLDVVGVSGISFRPSVALRNRCRFTIASEIASERRS